MVESAPGERKVVRGRSAEQFVQVIAPPRGPAGHAADSWMRLAAGVRRLGQYIRCQRAYLSEADSPQ